VEGLGPEPYWTVQGQADIGCIVFTMRHRLCFVPLPGVEVSPEDDAEVREFVALLNRQHDEAIRIQELEDRWATEHEDWELKSN
jgi:hypothetical protein